MYQKILQRILAILEYDSDYLPALTTWGTVFSRLFKKLAIVTLGFLSAKLLGNVQNDFWPCI